MLIENPAGRGDGVVGALNHLGVEVESPEEVGQRRRGFRSPGLDPDVEESTTCCYALQDKAWVNDPDGAPGRSTPSSPTRPVRECGLDRGSTAAEPAAVHAARAAERSFAEAARDRRPMNDGRALATAAWPSTRQRVSRPPS